MTVEVPHSTQSPPRIEDLSIALHLGAHKTASTYLQSCLELNQPSLADANTAILTPHDLRGQLVDRTPAPGGRGTPQARQRRQQRLTDLIQKAGELQNASRIVVSEENLIGSCRINLVHGELYPDLVKRLSWLPDWLNTPSTTVFMGIRSYASYFSSNLTTALQRGNCPNRQDVAKSLLGRRRG